LVSATKTKAGEKYVVWLGKNSLRYLHPYSDKVGVSVSPLLGEALKSPPREAARGDSDPTPVFVRPKAEFLSHDPPSYEDIFSVCNAFFPEFLQIRPSEVFLFSRFGS